MADIKIAGVMRAGAYSPNHIGNDAAIFNMVAEELRKRGCEVNIYTEEALLEGKVTESVILNMCREQASMHTLQKLEDAGKLVINSGYGIENCTRERMTRILQGHGIPYPQSLIVNTDERIVEKLQERGMERCWIKRGDLHAKHKEDVSHVRHAQEAQEILQEFFLRGIRRAVINRHLEGDLVKFYGIRGSEFFFYFYPFDRGYSKFGDEAINGQPHHTKFNAQALHDMCTEAAEALDIVIYGGDCIVDDEGNATIIDFNDWPSFAPCRQEAAPHIARQVLAMAKKHVKNE